MSEVAYCVVCRLWYTVVVPVVGGVPVVITMVVA